MLTAAIVLAYILMGIYSGIKNEPWWWVTLGQRLEPKHSYDRYSLEPRKWICHKCATKDREWTQNHIASVWYSWLFSGILWPLFPFIKFSIKVRDRELDAIGKKAKAAAEREQELKDAEAELADATTQSNAAKNSTDTEG